MAVDQMDREAGTDGGQPGRRLGDDPGQRPDLPPSPASPPRRVLFLDHTAKMGGGEVALLNLVQNLDPARYVPTVVLFSDGPLVEALQAVRVRTHLLPLSTDVAEARKDALGGRSLLRAGDAAAALGFVRRLARFIREEAPDLVHANSLKSDLLGAPAAKLARVPILWHVRDRIADDYLPPKVVRLFRLAAVWLPDCVVANSHATAKTLRRDEAAGGRRPLLRVVHDGTPDLCAEPAPPAAPTGHGPESAPTPGPRVGLVGRIARWKGQHVFLRAAARVAERFPDARFQVIGSAVFAEAEYEREVRALAADLKIADRVEFTGFRTDVPELVSRLDVLVHASVTGEPFGQVIIEGMAAGKPVVATDGGGVPEIVLHGRTGFLVPMGDDAAMARAIESLLADPGRAREMGRRGWERVRDFFTIGDVAENVQAVYDELLASRRAGR